MLTVITLLTCKVLSAEKSAFEPGMSITLPTVPRSENAVVISSLLKVFPACTRMSHPQSLLAGVSDGSNRGSLISEKHEREEASEMAFSVRFWHAILLTSSIVTDMSVGVSVVCEVFIVSKPEW